MKLSLLLEALGIREGFAETDITDLVYDSRKAGPGCAFFCLRGSAADGDPCDHDHFQRLHPDTNWRSCLEHGEKIGIGTRDYELIKI